MEWYHSITYFERDISERDCTPVGQVLGGPLPIFPLPSENTILNQWWFGGGGFNHSKKLISGTTIFFGDIVVTYLVSINIFMLKNYLQFFGLTMFTTPIVISVLACYWAGRNNWALIGQERFTCRLAKYSASLAKNGQQNCR